MLLPSLLAPFLVAGFYAAEAWAADGGLFGLPFCTPLAIAWPPHVTNPDIWDAKKVANPHARPRRLVTLALWPLAVVRLFTFDALGALARAGVFRRVGVRVVGMEEYLGARAHLGAYLQSLPQAVFQSAVYLLGNSRATRYFVDERIFVTSVVVSLLSVAAQLGMLFWDALSRGESFARLFWERPKEMRTVTLFQKRFQA